MTANDISSPMRIAIRHLFLALALLCLTTQVEAREILCGSIAITPNRDGGGPWDYTDPVNQQPNAAATQGYLKLVEGAHFTPEVEKLIRGKTGVKPLGDIAYTLYRFPNHHRALWAMSRLQRKSGGKLPTKPGASPQSRYVECYFRKAIMFKPDDPVVYMLYGMHLHLSGDLTEAEKQYKIAETYDPSNSELLYNMGLLFFDMEDYKRAQAYAKRAYDLGYPLPGLARKLKNIKVQP